jgi:poly(U)-specific endoribonuclease
LITWALFLVNVVFGNVISQDERASTVTDQELVDLSKQLHANDVNGVTGIVLNMQGKTFSGSSTDRAPAPLFTSLPSNALTGPTIKTLIPLFDNYEADTAVPEVVTSAEWAENDAFLDAITATKVMQTAHQFLVKKGLANSNLATFKKYLRTVWFGMYSRSSGNAGSSAIEHVFVGELKDGISGLHSWIRYYLEEQKGNANYLGYINRVDLGVSSMIEMPMKWNGVYKAISSIAVAGSPELEMALGTVCFLARPDALCPLQGSNGRAYNYQTYTFQYKGVTYIGTAYPTD